jgi:hypothetical protein
MTNKQKLKEIRRLLKEAYDHYFKHGDGHCKSAEGQISVHFGNYWTDGDDLVIRSVEIYSYVLGPSRSHFFDTIDEALETVKKWHHNEMNFDYEQAEKDEAEYWENYYKQYPKTYLTNPENPKSKRKI